MKFSIFTTLLAAATSVIAMPTPDAEPATSMIEKRQSLATKKTKTNTLMWSNSLNTFITARGKKSPSYLVWTSDGCTKSPDKPFGWNFVKGCYRHDFGYRNYKKQSRFTTANKNKIDKKFKTDLYYICDVEASWLTRGDCKLLANDYYNIMRLFTKRDDIEQAWDNAVSKVKRSMAERGIDADKGEHLSRRSVEDEVEEDEEAEWEDEE